MNGPGASNRSLYRMELRRSSASYPEGNFGGNQLLDGSIGLSPLHPVPTIDLHVRGASDFHQSFLWLHPDRAWIAIFRVPGRSLHQSRPSRTRKSDPGVVRPRTVCRARDLTDGRKEENDAPSATAETFLPCESRVATDTSAATLTTGIGIGGDAAPAESGAARKRGMSRTQSRNFAATPLPARSPPTRSLAFATPPGLVKWAPTTRERPGLLGPCFKTGRVGCRCTSLTRGGGRLDKSGAERPRRRTDPRTRREKSGRHGARSARPHRLAAGPGTRPRRWGGIESASRPRTRVIPR